MKLENYYMLVATIIWFIGFFHTGKFVRPRWKIPFKYLFYVFITLLLSNYFGHYAIIFVVLHPLIGLLFHISKCKQHQINWVNCQPTEKYIALQKKWAKGDFSSRIE